MPKIGHTLGMTVAFSILGRGRAGRALAEAWGDRVALLPHEARPDGWVLLAVPDHAVEGLSTAFPGRCVHLSGSLHLSHVPCAHPLTSFDGHRQDWRGTPLAVTGAVPAPILDAFQEIGFLPFQLEAEHKALYHACAVLVSGHAASLWVGAARLLESHGVRLPGEGFMPLVASTLRNIQAHGPNGMTGPFVRGDEATIQRDADALPGPWREIFLRLGDEGRKG